MTDVTNARAGTETAESEIHDLGYRRYEGTRVGAGGAWRSLFWQGFRAMFGLGRPAMSKVIPVFVVVVTNLPILASLSAASLSQGAFPLRFGQTFGQQLLLFVLFAAAQAPEVMSRDQQHRVLPLILTRDITRDGYASARYASVVYALFLVALGPLLLLYIGEIGIAAQPSAAFARMGWKIGPVLALATLTAISVGGAAVALSAWTPRRAYATAAIIGTFLAAGAIATSVDEMLGISRQSADLIDPLRSLRTEAMLLFGESNRRMELVKPMSRWFYAALLTGVGVVSALLLQLRIRRVSA